MIGIVTDSTCDLPREIAEEAGIAVIPAHINIGRQSLRDGIDISREEFYERLPTMPEPPTTSAPGPGAFVEVYERLLGRASHIISIHVASQLSSIYNAACLAAREIAPERIHVVDSGQTTMGLGWAVLAAVEALRESASLEGVLHSVQDTLRRVRVYAVLNTVEYLARSGRVSMVQLGLSNLLNIKPLIELREGVVSSLSRIRTWSRAVNALAGQVRSIAPIERLAVMHTNYLEGAEKFVTRIKDILPHPHESLLVNATTVIGAHVGPHGLGVAAVIKE
ncbi:MAG TPA: DegV family protein [Chloroflexi bacterium]|nr:DegV family protein [Chloroflexota bacterium]